MLLLRVDEGVSVGEKCRIGDKARVQQKEEIPCMKCQVLTIS